ncbi:hypothetical protein [Sodalis sp. C49]|uniref:hypothetical protein n=1 Tax=Sodalis sp. C49 TaxID=3228929 RepID=UPI003965C3B2
MLQTYLARGDVIKVTFENGDTGTIEAQARSQLAIAFPQSVKISRLPRSSKKLINENQK